MTLNYKKCTIADLDLLAKISKDTFIDAFEKDNNAENFHNYLNAAFSKTSLQKELLNSNSLFYFVYDDNVLVGYIKLNQNEAQNEQFDTPSIELERIYVYKEFQRKNIGKFILDKVIEMANQNKVHFIWLGVWEKNTSAIRFYKNNGFVKFNTHPYYIGNDKQIDWLMKLSLV